MNKLQIFRYFLWLGLEIIGWAIAALCWSIDSDYNKATFWLAVSIAAQIERLACYPLSVLEKK